MQGLDDLALADTLALADDVAVVGLARDTPGVEIQQAMTKVRAQVNEETSKGQLPWGHTNLIGSVYLNPAKAAGQTIEAPNTPAPTTTAASEVELEFWRSIKDSNKVEEYNAYLTNYPSGAFKAVALSRIASLQDGPSNATRNLSSGNVDQAVFSDDATQVTEDQLGLDKGQRRDVQRRLTGLGFDIKPTGKFDDATRAVISRWQAARGYPKTGYLERSSDGTKTWGKPEVLLDAAKYSAWRLYSTHWASISLLNTEPSVRKC